MKINFMKMNAFKISKKINFRTCASVLVIQVAVFGFQGFAEAGKEDALRAHYMAEGFDERVVKTVVVQGGATSGEDLLNKLRAAQALLPLLPPQEPLDRNRIIQVAALPEEDRVEGANLVAAQVEPTPDNIRIIRDVLDPNQKYAAAWMIGQGHARDPARIEAVSRMFQAGCNENKGNVTAPRIGAVANEPDADRKAVIAHLASLNRDAAFGGNENGNAVLAMRNAGADFNRITEDRIANWIGEGDADRKVAIAHLTALNIDSDPDHIAAMTALRTDHAGNPIDWARITNAHVNAYVSGADAARKAEIVHLAALHLSPNEDHIAAMTALRTDHAGHPIDWVRITNVHINAYIAGADAARKAEIVHLAALNLPAHGNNIAAMTALRTDHAGHLIAWNHITADHVNAYVAGDEARKAEIVHLAALNLPADADRIAAMIALRRDHAGNEIPWNHITHGRVENYVHDANPQQRAAIIHLTALNENANFGANENGAAVLAMRNAGAEYDQIIAERIAAWVNQGVAPADRLALSHVILTDVAKDNDHIDAAKKLIEATVGNITGDNIKAVAAEVPHERLAAAIIIKSGIRVEGDFVRRAKEAIAASQRAGATAPQAAQDLLDLHGGGEARLTVGNMIYLYNHHHDRADVLADMGALQKGAADGHPREISNLNLDALRARRGTADYLTYINDLPVV